MSSKIDNHESRARDLGHPLFERPVHRIGYIVELMRALRWVRGVTATELAEAWRLSRSVVDDYATEASRHLELLGQREVVLDVVRSSAHQWVLEAGQDRVQAARLLVDTVGGLAQKLDVSVQPAQLPDGAVIARVLTAIERAPEHHAALLAAADRIRARRLPAHDTEGELV